MTRLTWLIDAVLKVLITVVFGLLVICVTWQVFTRYALGAPSTITDELARFLFMWIALFGAAYTLGQRRHLAIDLLSIYLEGARNTALQLFVIFAIAGFAAVVMVYGGTQLAMKTLATGQVSPALRLPMGYVYCAIPASGLVILYYCLAFIHDIFIGDGQGADPESDVRPGGPLS